MSTLGSLLKRLSAIAHHADKLDAFDLLQPIRGAKAFHGLAEDTLTEMCARTEPITAKAGETIVSEGETGDYFYVVAAGRAAVSRKFSEGKRPIAELGPGAAFGEEALLANARRNATVQMLTDGLLMRLSKEDFDELFKEPILCWLSRVQAQREMEQGAQWLDVRPARESRLGTLSGARCIPLRELRDQAQALPKDRLYICCCRTGRMGATAAFLLSQMGYRAAVLRGGFERLPGFTK